MIKIFTKEGCPKCPPAKELAQELKDKGENVEVYSLDDPDGLAEASMYDVMATPSIIVTDSEGGEIKSFRGETPRVEDVIGA